MFTYLLTYTKLLTQLPSCDTYHNPVFSYLPSSTFSHHQSSSVSSHPVCISLHLYNIKDELNWKISTLKTCCLWQLKVNYT